MSMTFSNASAAVGSPLTRRFGHRCGNTSGCEDRPIIAAYLHSFVGDIVDPVCGPYLLTVTAIDTLQPYSVAQTAERSLPTPLFELPEPLLLADRYRAWATITVLYLGLHVFR